MKLASVLTLVIVLSVVFGGLSYQISELQNRNNVFEEQLKEYQSQTGQLVNQVDELEQENSELQNQTREQEAQLEKLVTLVNIIELTPLVNITEFTLHAQIVSWEVQSYANLSVHNFGTKDVDGLILRIKGVTPEGHREWFYGGELEVGLIKAGETKNVSFESPQGLPWGATVMATLMLDDIILDEKLA